MFEEVVELNMLRSQKSKNIDLAEDQAMEGLTVKDAPPVQNALAVYDDPANIQSLHSRLPPFSTSLPSAGSGHVAEISSHAAQMAFPRSTFRIDLLFYQPGQTLGSWGSSPSPNTDVSGLKTDSSSSKSQMAAPWETLQGGFRLYQPGANLGYWGSSSFPALLNPGQLLHSRPVALSSPVSSGEVFQAATSKPAPAVPATTQEPILPLPSQPNQKQQQKQNVAASQGGFVCYFDRKISQVSSNQAFWEERIGAVQRIHEILGEGLERHILDILPADSLRGEGALSYQWQNQLSEPDMDSSRQLSFKSNISEENYSKFMSKEPRWKFLLQNLASSSSISALVLHSEPVRSTDEGSSVPGKLMEHIPLRPVIPDLIPLPIQEQALRKGVPIMEFIRRRCLVSKSRESATAELYFWDSSVVYTLRVDEWANCGFIASNPSGWFLLLKDDGSLFYLDLKWGEIVRLPPLPAEFQKEECVVLGTGWKGTFTCEPHDPRNITVLLGSVRSIVNGTRCFVVLWLENNHLSWNVFRDDVLFYIRAISGPLIYLERKMVVWVSNGNTLETFFLEGENIFGSLFFSLRLRSLPRFQAGSSPVNLIIRHGWLYLFQDTGQRFNPLLYKLDLRGISLEVLIKRPPVNFFMIESSRGWPEDWKDEDEEGSEGEAESDEEESLSEDEEVLGEELDLQTMLNWMGVIMLFRFIVPNIDPVPRHPKYLFYANTSGMHLATCYYTHFSLLNACWEDCDCLQCCHEFAFVGDLPD